MELLNFKGYLSVKPVSIGKVSSRGGLEVEQWTDNSNLSISVGSNPARRQKDFHSNSNTTGGALINNLKINKIKFAGIFALS